MRRNLLNLLLLLVIFKVNGQNTIMIQSKTFTPKQLYNDIDYALIKFEQIHPNFYRETPKDTVIKRFSELKSKITQPMTRYEFMNIFTPVAFTMIHDGHNFVFPLEEEFDNYTKNGGLLFPIPVTIQNRMLYCNSSKTAIPYKSEIIQINSKYAKDIIENILGGYKSESVEFDESLYSGWFSKSYWQTIGGFDKYKIKFVSNIDSTQKELLINGLAEKQIDSIRENVAMKSFEFEEIPNLQTAVFKYNSADNNLNELKSFCDSIFMIIKEKNTKI